MSGYPVILGGDHAAFEAEWAASGRPDSERPDWPLPSFYARDWAAAFCKLANGFGFKDTEGKPLDEGWLATWFANALMRGYDEHAAQTDNSAFPEMLAALRSIMATVSPGGFEDIKRLKEEQILRIRHVAGAAIAKATGA